MISFVCQETPSEYWNNRILLTSLKTQFFSRFFQVTKGSLTNFYCLNIHEFISWWKIGIPGTFQFYRRSLISCGLCVSFNMKALLSTEKIPLECESLVFFVVLPNFQKLIKQFLLFYYSCIYISVKKRNSGKTFNSSERAWFGVYFV